MCDWYMSNLLNARQFAENLRDEEFLYPELDGPILPSKYAAIKGENPRIRRADS